VSAPAPKSRIAALLLGSAAIAVSALLLAFFVLGGGDDEPARQARATGSPEGVVAEPVPPPARERTPAGEAEPAGEIGEDPLSLVLDADEESALRWSRVDLDEVREALPDNLYWQMSVPTDDPDVLQRRADERARWNVEYGKVLSGSASEEEIEDYFDLRRRISQDAVSFAEYLLLNHGSDLPERDVSLLSLASRLHRARLEEMPRRMTEALERKQRQDRLREEWLADEKAFEEAQRVED